MPSDSVEITKPVEIQNDAKARVAFDLMDHISRREGGRDAEQKTREYWFTLYVQCYKAASGDLLKHVLEQK
jgi:hypothetical protein